MATIIVSFCIGVASSFAGSAFYDRFRQWRRQH